MGQVTSAIAAMRHQKIYLDTNVFIYFLEPHPVFFPVAAAFMNAAHAKTLQGYTGELAVAETLVAPYRANDSKLVADVKRFFRAKDFLSVLPHDAPIFDTAAQLRARQHIKFIDALHVATAMRSSCTFFITNDRAIRSINQLDVVLISDLL